MRTAATILLVIIGAAFLTLVMAGLVGCQSTPQQQGDQTLDKPRPFSQTEISVIGTQFSERFQAAQTERGERYRLALLEGRKQDACRLDNDFIHKAQQLCRDSPIPFEGCWDIIVKETSDCSALPNKEEEPAEEEEPKQSYPPYRTEDPPEAA